jgi:hypothetical protein
MLLHVSVLQDHLQATLFKDSKLLSGFPEKLMNYPIFIISKNDLGENLDLNKKNILFHIQISCIMSQNLAEKH